MKNIKKTDKKVKLIWKINIFIFLIVALLGVFASSFMSGNAKSQEFMQDFIDENCVENITLNENYRYELIYREKQFDYFVADGNNSKNMTCETRIVE